MKKRNRPPQFTRFSVLLLITLATLALFAGAAAADLLRFGPINPTSSVGNYPAWYQDNTGITLEFCDPNAGEVAGGWCLVGPAEVPNPPEVFPDEFTDEHFYYSVAADHDILWEAAIEAAFGGDVVDGGQVVFTRIRFRLNDVPVTGTYRFIHPYGIDNVVGVVGERIFVTQDVGVAEGDFTGALKSRVGPFLLPSATAGGAELAPVPGPAPGKLYIADPARIGPVTGSLLPNFIACPNSDPCSPGESKNHNIFRVEGPPGSNIGGTGVDFIETANFTMVGRLLSGEIPGDVTVDRAEYTRNGAGEKVEVYATGLMTLPKRLPADPLPTPFRPQLSFFNDNCVIGADGYTYVAPGGADTAMFNTDDSFWAQNPSIPAEVCIVDSVSDAGFPKTVVDEITISQAYYNPTAQTLSVRARSGDEVNPPTLTLEGLGDLTDEFILVDPLVAPPAYAFVLSSAGGSNSFQVTTTAAPIVLEPADAVTLTASPAGTAQSGDNVTFTGLASGGSAPYEYQFMAAVAGSDFVTAQSYTPTDNWVWDTTGSPAGAYIVQVFARSIGSQAALEALGTVNYTLTVAGTAPTSVTLVAAPADNTATGGSVTYTATVNDGTGPFEYEFRARVTPAGSFVLAQPYTATNNWAWNTTGSPAGGYEVQVNVRRVGQVATEATTTIPYVLTGGGTAPTSVTLNAVPADNTATGNSVTYTATVNDGTGPFEYEFRARVAPAGSFVLAQPYTPTNNWAWDTTGSPAGDYEVQVNVRRTGQVATETTTTIPYVLTLTP